MFTYKPTKTFKLVLVGDVSVGKTCLLKRFIKNNFCYIHEPTIGSEFSEYFLHNDDNIIKLLIWDTCGEERFRAIAPIYYRDADAAVVVYDINDCKTFNSADVWVNILKHRVSENLTIALVGNKIDLMIGRQVNSYDAEDYARKNNLLFMETSAKCGINAKEVFITICMELSNRRYDSINRKRIKLHEEKHKNNSFCC